MDTVKKFGLEKNKAVLLFVQMILVCIGLLAQIGLSIYVCVYDPEWNVIVASICMVLTFISIGVYATVGYKKGKIFYLCAIGLFLLAILFNMTVPFRDSVQKIFLTLLFGVFTGFALKLDNFKISNILAVSGVVFALVFSIYSSCFAKVDAFGPVKNHVLAALCMHYSILSPVIVSGLLALTNNIRNTRQK